LIVFGTRRHMFLIVMLSRRYSESGRRPNPTRVSIFVLTYLYLVRCVTFIETTICYLAKQELSFSGYDEQVSSVNRENCLQLIRLIKLSGHFSTSAVFSGLRIHTKMVSFDVFLILYRTCGFGFIMDGITNV